MATPIQITENTISVINKLNQQLKQKCRHLELHVHPDGYEQFKLCLINNNIINNNNCVSHLTINTDNGTFNILSQTLSEYQGMGYNKFLTAVSICLANTMTECIELFSSTKVEARIHILSEYEHRLEKDKDDEDISIFFVPINDNNKNKANSIINEWIGNKCVKGKATYTCTGRINKWIENMCGKATYTGRGKKTRRNKQRRKSKKRKTKRLYK